MSESQQDPRQGGQQAPGAQPWAPGAPSPYQPARHQPLTTGYGPRHPDIAVAGFIVSLIAFLVALIPMAGLLGLLGLILGVVPLARASEVPVKKGLAIAAVVLGGLATLAGLGWSYLIMTSSCPYVYSFDGERYQLDADPLSGSIFEGGASTDWDRLEHLAAVDGEYRLRVANERDERDVLDELSLLVLDHPAGTEALPTPTGAVLAVGGARPALRCVDERGRDRLAQVRSADELAYSGGAAEEYAADEAPRARLVCTFERPEGEQAVLLIRAHNSQLAADAFVGYLAEMGPGVGPLLSWSQDSSCCDYRDHLAEESRRLGLPLEVRVGAGEEGPFGEPLEVRPIGPAVLRSVALPLTLPPGDGPVRVELSLSPLLWEVDRLALGAGTPLEPRRVRPRGAGEAQAALSGRDERRLSLERGDQVELVFDAPPAADQERTVVLEISGYYEIEVGGRAWIDPLAIWRDQTGRDSLPRFALRLAASGRLPTSR